MGESKRQSTIMSIFFSLISESRLGSDKYRLIRIRRTIVCLFHRKSLRQQFVRAMTRSRIVSPCDHHQFVEFSTLCKFFQSLGNLFFRSDNRLAAKLLRSCHFR